MIRPAVSVIVPFKGSMRDANRIVTQLTGLQVRTGDELIVADNCPVPTVKPTPSVRVVRADRLASSYHARNAGARAAACDWLLFVDSDCLLPPNLIDDFFAEPVPDSAGILAGELEAASGQTALTARYERSRGHLEVAQHMSMGPGPVGITANLLVRRAVWDSVGGFSEVKSGADLEFCWRASGAGHEVAYRPEARVRHLHTESLGALVRKSFRYGPGQAWVNRRFPGSSPPPRVAPQIARALAGTVIWPLRGQFERGLFKALDGVWELAYALGYRFGSNEPKPLTPP